MGSRRNDNPHYGDGASPGFVLSLCAINVYELGLWLMGFSGFWFFFFFFSFMFVFWCSKIFIGGLAKDTTYGKREHSILFYDSLDGCCVSLDGCFWICNEGLCYCCVCEKLLFLRVCFCWWVLFECVIHYIYDVVLVCFWLSSETFVSYFEKYGKITDSVIMKDRHTHRPRGFGFITYEDPSVVDQMIQETHVINGKQVILCSLKLFDSICFLVYNKLLNFTCMCVFEILLEVCCIVVSLLQW